MMGMEARRRYEETSTMEIYEKNIISMIIDKMNNRALLDRQRYSLDSEAISGGG